MTAFFNSVSKLLKPSLACKIGPRTNSLRVLLASLKSILPSFTRVNVSSKDCLNSLEATNASFCFLAYSSKS